MSPDTTDYRTEVHGAQAAHVEDPAFPPLVPINIKQTSDAVDQPYKNFVLNRVNDHCIRVAVMVGEYKWHHHPRSDETFLVMEGAFEIDLEDGRTLTLHPGDLFTIPAGVRHRTRARTRTVNLCFENTGAYTDVVFDAAP
jgi:mannose-6-phosphate isomerase-like protein (cupin superfamily)